jgi:hypothetical protein
LAGLRIAAKAPVLLLKPVATGTKTSLEFCGRGLFGLSPRSPGRGVVPEYVAVGDQVRLAHLPPRRRSTASRSRAGTIRRCAIASFVALPCKRFSTSMPQTH